MTFAVGTRLGPYEIQSLLGKGGMGEVYAARDIRLDRQVAIKTVRAQGEWDTEALKRFQREARAIAALNHPNICVLHDIGNYEGTDYIVMEYLEGRTLEERLRKGPMPVSDMIKVGTEMADALNKAHQHGIIHRDIKPSNVMLTRSGAKLLDFGVAELVGTDFSRTFPVTAETVPSSDKIAKFAGTVKYAAPEQFRGGPIDARTDIFSFGVLMYEMAAGLAPFQSPTYSGLVTTILTEDPPPLSEIRPDLPPALDHLISVCLKKDPADRWQNIQDIAQQLPWLERNAGAAPAASRTPKYLTIISGVLLLLAIIALALTMMQPSDSGRLVRLSQVPPPNVTIPPAALSYVAASPDGESIAFVASPAGRPPELWVRALSSLEARALAGTENASYPFWSPDSRHLGFFSEGKLKRVDIQGGQPLALADAPNGTGGTWSSAGTILFAPDGTVGGLQSVTVAGGGVRTIKPRDPSRPETVSWQPWFLPDGKRFLYLMGPPITIHVGSIDSPETSQALFAADSKAIYAEPGYLLFVRDGTLLAQEFDAKSLRTEGAPVQIADRVTFNPIVGLAAFSASDNGTLVYHSGASSLNSQLVWSDRSGNIVGRIDQERRFAGIDLSRDERTIVTHIHEGSGGDLWLVDTLRGVPERMTFQAQRHFSDPIFSPDGREAVFVAGIDAKSGLYRGRVRSDAPHELLLETQAGIWPTDWTADGESIVYVETDSQRKEHLWIMSLKDKKARRLFSSNFNDSAGHVSPNMKWIAYMSDESGRNEVSIRTFPDGEKKWQVSNAGGAYPRWRPDNKELFFVSNNILMSVPINEQTGEPGQARPLFPVKLTQTSSRTYAVRKNGEQFLLSRQIEDPAAFATTVILNWTVLISGR